MSDERIMNVSPSAQNLAIAASLPTGLHAPKNIVNNKVEINEETLVKVSVENISMPAKEDAILYDIAKDSVDETNVILVDDQVRICNMRPSSNPENDFTIVQAFLASGIDEEKVEASLPQKLDLRESWWVVKDQGPTGACAGFSASSLCEYAFTKTGRLPPGEQISPRPLWMGAKETDIWQKPSTFIEQEGTSLTAILKILQSDGCVTEKFMPFNSLFTKPMQSYYLAAAGRRILSYFNLGKTIDAWKKWLSQYGPIYAAITVDKSWQNATATNGILERYDSSQMYGGHAVVICGYDTQNKRILFKNSWGDSWGDGGYAWASDSWCLQAVLEAYGVAV